MKKNIFSISGYNVEHSINIELAPSVDINQTYACIFLYISAKDLVLVRYQNPTRPYKDILRRGKLWDLAPYGYDPIFITYSFCQTNSKQVPKGRETYLEEGWGLRNEEAREWGEEGVEVHILKSQLSQGVSPNLADDAANYFQLSRSFRVNSDYLPRRGENLKKGVEIWCRGRSSEKGGRAVWHFSCLIFNFSKFIIFTFRNYSL